MLVNYASILLVFFLIILSELFMAMAHTSRRAAWKSNTKKILWHLWPISVIIFLIANIVFISAIIHKSESAFLKCYFSIAILVCSLSWTFSCLNWTNVWWRKRLPGPIWLTRRPSWDRWHILSFLSHYPINIPACLFGFIFYPNSLGFSFGIGYTFVTIIASYACWSLAKTIFHRNWPSIWTQ